MGKRRREEAERLLSQKNLLRDLTVRNERNERKGSITMRTLLIVAGCLVSMRGIAAEIPAEMDMPPTEVLEKEHTIIRKMAAETRKTAESLKESEAIDVNRLRKLHDFFVNFADRCHHGKEEDALFPVLREAAVDPTVIDLLMKQHEEGRILLAGVKREIDAYEADPASADVGALSRYLLEYGRLMPRHIDTENKYLWPKARAVLDKEQKDKLTAAFYRIETVELGAGFHEKYHAMAMELLGKKE